MLEFEASLLAKIEQLVILDTCPNGLSQNQDCLSALNEIELGPELSLHSISSHPATVAIVNSSD